MCFRTWERESYGALIIMSAIQQDTLCACEGHIFICIHMCIRSGVRVYGETLFFGVRIDLAWTKVTPSK